MVNLFNYLQNSSLIKSIELYVKILLCENMIADYIFTIKYVKIFTGGGIFGDI